MKTDLDGVNEAPKLARPKQQEAPKRGGGTQARGAKRTGPKQPRNTSGKRRVEALLEAAAATFVDNGFDASTMTEIAQRAGSSIGSLYQFFPTKESLAGVLSAQYCDTICAELKSLAESDHSNTSDELAASLIRIKDEAIARHPSYSALIVVRNRLAANLAVVRERYSAALAHLFASRMPDLDPGDIRTTVIVVRQILRWEIDLELEWNERECDIARIELQALLASYLAIKMRRTAS